MFNTPLILRLNKSGMPIDWLTKKDAVCIFVKDHISWSMGDSVIPVYGGTNRLGRRTVIELPSIIATVGEVHYQRFVPPLENKLLFRRDRNMCLYCGKVFPKEELSRDHVVPRFQGGRDRWTNVVTACRKCNHRKGCRTPEQANMELLAVPFTPNQFEFLYMANKRILSDQMEFLASGFSEHGRFLQ